MWVGEIGSVEMKKCFFERAGGGISVLRAIQHAASDHE